MNKHTPGPWISQKADDLHGHDHFVMTASGFLGYLPKESEGGGVQLFTEQDARLIATAPELLALLMESQKFIGGDWRERRDALIAKATGETA